MPQKRQRQCPRCGTRTTARSHCGIDLMPWRMNKRRIRAVHACAMGRKGLDYETYRLHLLAVGVESSKNMTRSQYQEFFRRMQRLPDRNRRSAA